MDNEGTVGLFVPVGIVTKTPPLDTGLGWKPAVGVPEDTAGGLFVADTEVGRAMGAVFDGVFPVGATLLPDMT